MKLGIYGDAHLTKNMRTLQSLWDTTAMDSFHHMYDKFDEESVDMAICLGDFFDSPRLEAKHLSLILPILHNINSRSYPTYILLGNHEAESEDSNILEVLSIYENIHPVTIPVDLESMLFLPYYTDPTQYDMKNKIVFTHHDIYGSELAGGKTKAFFGLDSSIFKDAMLVINGHVHLRSRVSKNIVNSGSILVSQQGELKLGDYPHYYILDTISSIITDYPNIYSMIYLTVDESEIESIVKFGYNQMNCVLRVEYKDKIPENIINTAHTTWRRKIYSIESREDDDVHLDSFDMKNYLVDYINNDAEISDEKKSDYIATGLEVLG